MNSRSNTRLKSSRSSKQIGSGVKFSSRKKSGDQTTTNNNFDESQTEFQCTTRLNQHNQEFTQTQNFNKQGMSTFSKESFIDENNNMMNKENIHPQTNVAQYSKTIRNEIQNLIQQASQHSSANGQVQQSDAISQQQQQQQNCLMDRRKSKQFMFPHEEEKSKKIGCLLMMKSNRNYGSGAISGKSSTIMASTAPQSSHAFHKQGENNNKFFLILDENDQSSMDKGEIYNINSDERISQISEIPSNQIYLQDNTYLHQDDTSSLIEIIKNPDAQLRFSLLKQLELSQNSINSTTANSILDYGQTVKAQNVYQSIKPKGPMMHKEPFKYESKLPPQNQGDIYQCDLTNTTTMMSPQNCLSQKLFMFKPSDSECVMKKLTNNKL